MISSDVVTGFCGLVKCPLPLDKIIYLRIENTDDNSKKKKSCVLSMCGNSVSVMGYVCFLNDNELRVEGEEIRLFWFSLSFDRFPLAPRLDEQVYSVSAPFHLFCFPIGSICMGYGNGSVSKVFDTEV